MPSWEIPVICISLFLVFMSVGLLGGACEYIFCTRRKRTAVHDDLDFGCRGTPSGSPQLGSDQSTLVGDRPPAAAAAHDDDAKVREEEELGRYSWRDDKGVTTEVYMDGKIPGAGPLCVTPRKTVSRAQNGRYEAIPSMSEQPWGQKPSSSSSTVQERHRGIDQSNTVVSPISPEEAQFAVHDEQDDLEYQLEQAQMAGHQQHPGGLVGYYGTCAAEEEEQEPMGARSMPWQDDQHGVLSPVRRENYRDDLGGNKYEGGEEHGQSAEGEEFKPWLPTVDLTIDDEPLHEITIRDYDAETQEEQESTAQRPSVEGMWKTHPTQFL